MSGCWIQIANSNTAYFNNSKASDVVIRTNDSVQKILISPIDGNGGNAVLQVTNTGIDVVGDVQMTGKATIGNVIIRNGTMSNVGNIYSINISANTINLSPNHIITYDQTDGKIKFGPVGQLSTIGDDVGMLSASCNLRDVTNSVDARSNIGLGLTNSVTFSNIDVSGNYYKNGVIFEGGGTTNWNYLTNYVIPTLGTVTDRKLMDGNGQLHSGFISNGTVYMFGNNDHGQLGLNDITTRYTPQPIKGVTTPVTSMATGTDFTVIVLQDGTAMAYGNNLYGQLGDGTTIRRYAPVVVTGLPVGKIISTVSAGNNFVIYLMTDGTAYGFGGGESGQLGNGLQVASNVTAQQFLVSYHIARITCGAYHTIAILQNGVVVMSGSNSMGQLGSDPTIIANVLNPSPLANFGPCVSAACGKDFTIIIKDDGTVGSMGNNAMGQLGRTGVSYMIEPITQVANEINNGMGIYTNRGLSMKVDAGFEHAMIISYTGKVYVFGRNNYGQLGFGQAVLSYNIPTLLNALSGYVATSVACGKYHTLVMVDGDAVTPANTIFGFGLSANGQLGDFQNDSNVLGVQTNPLLSIRWSPVNVIEIEKIKIYCGKGHNSAIIKNNTVLTSGSRYVASAYVLANTNRFQPRAKGFENISVHSMSMGIDHDVILDSTGKVYALGDNQYGQLGTGNTTNALVPMLINTGAIFGKIIVSIACGGVFTVALDNIGKVYTWGYNWFGELGVINNIRVDTSNPIPFLVDHANIASMTIVSIACGEYHTIALDNMGKLFAWGLNVSGQLGIVTNSGTNNGNWIPTLINHTNIINKTIVTIACNGYHTVALDNMGNLYAWGANRYGQLGIVTNSGTTNANPTPTLINHSNIANKIIVSIACGNNHTIALDNKGKLYAWGYNKYGQLGIVTNSGTTNANPTPTLINHSNIANKIIVSIACGYDHTIALDNMGNLYAWGANWYGQFGLGNASNYGTNNANPTPTIVPYTVFDPEVTPPIISKGYSNHKIFFNRPNNFQPTAFGDNTFGQLGDGTTTTRTYPMIISGLMNLVQPNYTPVITSASNGVGFTAMVIDGCVWTWGNNSKGQCGFDPITTSIVAYPRKLSAFTDALKVMCGDGFMLVQSVGNALFRIGKRIGTIDSTVDITPIAINGILIKEMAAGQDHAAVITTTGDVYTWGDATYGATGFSISSSIPTLISRSTFNYASAKNIACGQFHTIIALDDATVYTAGRNHLGQLGRVSEIDRVLFFQSLDINTGIGEVYTTNTNDSYSTLFTKYGIDVNFYIISKQDQCLYRIMFKSTTTSTSRAVNVWKSIDNGNTFVAGALFPANASTNFNVDPPFAFKEQSEWSTISNWATQKTFGRISPTGLNGIPVQVSCGFNFSTVLLNTGVIVSFGDNINSQMGVIATTTYRPVKTAPAINFEDMMYIESGGNSTFATSEKVRVVEVIGEYFGWGTKMITSAWQHAIVLDNMGKLYSWGNNDYSQLGTGNTISSIVPLLINTGAIANNIIISISSIESHTIAIDKTGKLYAWGWNGFGQLGNGNTNDSSVSLHINIGAIKDKIIVTAASGGMHTVALDNMGNLYAWGRDAEGQLGDGTTTASWVPMLINTGAIAGKIIIGVSCGYFHTTVLDNMGNLYAWGYNWSGQSGNGTTGQTTILPVLINTGAIAGKIIIGVSCGDYHTIAIDNTGKLYAWGSNESGQLGDGTITASWVPVLINTGAIAGRTIIGISGGYGYSSAIDNMGNLYTWGLNDNGQLGDGTTTNSSVPVLINTGAIAGRFIVSVSCGFYYTIALDNMGKLYTWGLNDNGQLGNGTTTNSLIPIVLTLVSWNTSTAGGNTPVLINFTGQHRCLLDQLDQITNLTGRVVVSDKNMYVSSDMMRKYSKLSVINDALPIVSLSTKRADKAVFGVISQGIDLGIQLRDKNEMTNMVNYSDKPFQDNGDTRLQINSVGEGCIWVIEDSDSTPLESGDLLMSSDTPGYSMLQTDDLMHGYTIAKLTRSCDWKPKQIPIQIAKINIYNKFVIDDITNQPVFINVTVPESTDTKTGIVTPEHIQTEEEYTIRYINSVDGCISTKEAYDLQETQFATDQTTLKIIKRAALLGCTYHCG